MKTNEILRFRKKSERVLGTLDSYIPVIQVWEEVSDEDSREKKIQGNNKRSSSTSSKRPNK